MNKKDLNQRAKSVVDIATGEKEKPTPKNPHAVALGRAGGLKGGKARAAKMTKSERSEAAQKAAKARWATKKPKK